NTFINGPRHLRNTFQTQRDERLFFAGQITGVEGYVESSAVGLLVARYIDELARDGAAHPLPYHTALGALGRHVAESSPDRYQPANRQRATRHGRGGWRGEGGERRRAKERHALPPLAFSACDKAAPPQRKGLLKGEGSEGRRAKERPTTALQHGKYGSIRLGL